jgi:hypothetical protein
MKKSLTLFLQIILVLIGVVVLVALLWEPQLEGVNAHATLFEIYFTDPFLACVYLGSVPFFVGLYGAFKLVGYAGQNKIFSPIAVKALKKIKYCALVTAAAIVLVDIYIRIAAVGGEDDPAGVLMLGMIATFVALVAATTAAVFQKVLQNAVDMKAENDLTV